MNPTQTRGKTKVYGAPENWDERKLGSCGSLEVREEIFREHAVEIFSTWKPTEAEIAHIVRGGVIEIGLMIPRQCVMQVGVVDPVAPAVGGYDDHGPATP